MKFLFFVQSEGRGHLSQALTMKIKLEERGHQVLAVIAGDGKRPLPAFFREEINTPIFLVNSPNFILDKKGEGIRTVASVLSGIKMTPGYIRSLQKIKKIVDELSPEAFISFYEPLAGAYARLYRDRRPYYCIAHQYFIGHPACQFPPGDYADRRFFHFFNRLTAPQHSIKIALSFTAESDQPDKSLYVVPPLIRPIILSQKPSIEDFLLIYLLNPGYRRQIIDWSTRHPDTIIEAFSSGGDIKHGADGKRGLIWHELSGAKFIDRLRRCRAYISTAGFDSIAEAAYLGKDILMVPTKNHYEQKCNAVDARRAGLAIAAENFDLDLIAGKTKTHSQPSLRAYREWVNNYNDKIIDILEQ